jgi:thiamine transport system ATP-binding protein
MLRVSALSAGFGDDPDVLVDVDLEVGPGEVVALLGPSGSGKSTLLRCVAGLHPPRRGRIELGGADVADVPVERRGVGLVFQDHALLPHRDVAGNVALGPRLQRLGGEEVAARVTAALRDVGLAALADRPVDALSGGEQQRVALARALAARPRLLLLDEPYGSLDRPLRARLLAELPALVRAAGAAALLVTHDQDDALAVADRVAVLIDGRLRQLAPPELCWTRPADPEVAAFLGVGPLLATDAGDGRPLLPAACVRLGGEADRPDDLVLTARLEAVRFAGDHHLLTLAVDGAELRLRRPRPPRQPVGADVEVRIAPGDVLRLPARPDAARVAGSRQ